MAHRRLHWCAAEKGRVVKKKKRKDENGFLDEIQWCVKYRKCMHIDGNWNWSSRTINYNRHYAIRTFCDGWVKGSDWWTAKRKAGIVACVKVKLVEQP